MICPVICDSGLMKTSTAATTVDMGVSRSSDSSRSMKSGGASAVARKAKAMIKIQLRRELEEQGQNAPTTEGPKQL